MGRGQVGEGANSLDIRTAFVGRGELSEMGALNRRVTSSVKGPLVIDSTDTNVIEAALKLRGGKPIINSIKFGEEERGACDRMILAWTFGAALTALTIDEGGIANTAEDKLRIARRLVDFACDRHGLAQGDLLIDPATFTFATRNEDRRKLGRWTRGGMKVVGALFGAGEMQALRAAIGRNHAAGGRPSRTAYGTGRRPDQGGGGCSPP